MFRHSQKHGSTRQQELEADYMARALLMPLNVIREELTKKDYVHMDKNEKKRFVQYISDKYQVPTEHAFLRIKEVLLLSKSI